MDGVFSFKQAVKVKGQLNLLGDKSIAHRAIILSSMAFGKTTIYNFPFHNDSEATIKSFQALGVDIVKNTSKNIVYVNGVGLRGFKESLYPISTGESGTTFRLLLGVLAGQNFSTQVTADTALANRPMKRVTIPLRLMGAKISARINNNEEYAPIIISGGNIKAIKYKMPVESAQVKSAILLAGLYADKVTQVIEKNKSRDHTERMLKLFGVKVYTGIKTVKLYPSKKLISPKEIYIPSDISSASFFIVLVSILKESEIIIKNVNLNSSRMGIIKVLKRMGANIVLKKNKSKDKAFTYEPMGDIYVKSSCLKATKIKSSEIPSLIDELPILMVAAIFAKGTTYFESVKELRVKETDRINSMADNLALMGGRIEIIKNKNNEDLLVTGMKNLKGAAFKSYNDHRTAMSMIIAGLAVSGESSVDEVKCINKSFPNFIEVVSSLTS